MSSRRDNRSDVATLVANLSVNIRDLAKVNLHPSMFTHQPTLSPNLDRGLKVNPRLRGLLDKPPVLTGKATRQLDGRHVPVVIVIVRDREGVTRPGILVRLVQDDRLRDHSRTNARGIVLLRFPAHPGHDHPGEGGGGNGGDAPAGPVTGAVEVLAPGIEPVSREVTVEVERGHQHAVIEIVLERLPGAGGDVGGNSDGDDAGGVDDAPSSSSSSAPGAGVGASALRVANLTVPVQDNPLDRLPADFTTALCADLTALLGTSEDPILGLLGESTDFRTRRIPRVIRKVVARIGANPPGEENPPRRYLVRVRQEWTFLGYTLGELANIESLDPGAVLQETTESVQRLTQRVSRTLDSFTSQAFETASSTLRQFSSIDTLVDLSTTTSTIAGAAGFGFFIPPFIGGAVGGGARVSVNSSTRTDTNTSLVVNSSLHVAKSLVNQALRTAVSTLRDVENTVTNVVGRVSPLLSRVTNLLRWTLYENYIVCTHVEDVVEVIAERAVEALGSPATPLFSDEDIVEYEPFFSRALLNQKLRPEFDVLRRAVAVRRAVSLPVTVVHVTVDYSAVRAGADLTITVAGEESIVQLRRRTTRVRESFRLAVPIAMPLAGTSVPPVTASLALAITDTEDATAEAPGVVRVRKATFRLETTPGGFLEDDIFFGDDLQVRTDGDATAAPPAFGVRVPPPAIFTQGNALFIHVNRNRHYYYGLLAQAALNEPSLRDDAPQIASAFNGDHDLWRLPIIGFEADRVLVIGDVDEADPDVQTFLADEGAATIIQLAAPGAYSEALQGLLQLADAAGKIHPNLIPLPAPVMPPLALVDLTGRQLQVVPAPGDGGVLPVPGGGGLPIP